MTFTPSPVWSPAFRRWGLVFHELARFPDRSSRRQSAHFPKTSEPTYVGCCGDLRPAGFTLTELLVTVAVLMLLAAVLLPVLSRVQGKSRLATCIANLNEVGQAVAKYAQANQQRMPAMVNKPPGGWWWYKETVKSYAGLSGPPAPAKIFACPSDRGYDSGTEKPKPFHADAKHNFTSYVFNGVNLPGIPNIAGRAVASIHQPQRTLMVLEWTAHAPLSWHKSLTGRANAPFYCDAESVVAFVDGHVKLIKIYYDGMNPAYSRDPIPGYEYKFSGD